ncbi:MAG: UDP-N-acetylmuramoyl-L-alanyl-D-glutamate--2,6-diaminopimelate ligase [Peptococcaceae bacterium]|nr:UDP-N-acetylmuramoyl-L-alanyl-D-glutamate--2,6-diaminopimelate ligase [Peptococcaceae bacterium]
MSKTVAEIADFLKAETNGLGLTVSVAGVYQDSRRVMPGSLFVCVVGMNADGHDFAEAAIEAGAGALLVERFLPWDIPQIRVHDIRAVVGELAALLYEKPALQLKLVGVTGTNGKTTVVSLISHVAARLGQKSGMIGTLGVEFDGCLTPGSHTTPEAIDIQAALSRMVDEGADLAVMEVSSHALRQGRINGCAFDVMIFTNLTQDHLDYHSSMEDYLEAKSLAFSREDFYKNGRISLLNGDDPSCAYLREKALSSVTFGIDAADLDYRAANIAMSDRGVGFDVLCARDEVCHIHVQTPGRFSVYNALAVFAWARESGYNGEAVCDVLAGIPGVPGRFESMRCGQDFQVIVDYAHTPDGLVNVLTTAREITAGRLICVFGCGGDRDRSKRPLMGKAVASLSDIVIVTSDNPRSEDPMAIIRDILPGLEGVPKNPQHSPIVEVNRYKAIAAACRLARAGDTVVIAGKGHEDYQIIGKDTIHFDDREVATEILTDLCR